MAARLTVEEVLAQMEAKRDDEGNIKTFNQFNKKNFTKLLKAMMNDPSLTTQVAKVTKGQLESVEEIAVGSDFRNWCRKLVEKAGVDPNESQVVMTKDFQIDSADGLYEFFATAVWLYMEKGNLFQLLPKEDCKAASFGVKKVKANKTVRATRNPITGEDNGTFEFSEEDHREMFVKNAGCPDYLKQRKKV